MGHLRSKWEAFLQTKNDETSQGISRRREKGLWNELINDRALRRFVPSIVTIVILVIIYWRIDWTELVHHLSHLRWSYFVSGVSLFLVTTILGMERWRLTLRGTVHIRARDALAVGFGVSL